MTVTYMTTIVLRFVRCYISVAFPEEISLVVFTITNETIITTVIKSFLQTYSWQFMRNLLFKVANLYFSITSK